MRGPSAPRQTPSDRHFEKIKSSVGAMLIQSQLTCDVQNSSAAILQRNFARFFSDITLKFNFKFFYFQI